MAILAALVVLVASASAEQSAAPADWSPMLDGTAANFEKLVLDSPKPVFILFYVRDGCRACAPQHEVLKNLMPDYSGRVVFIRVEANREPAIAVAASVKNVPTSFVLKPREATGAVVEGFLDAPSMRKFIDGAIALPPKTGAGSGSGSGSGKETIRRISDPSGRITWPAIPPAPHDGARPMAPLAPKR